MDTKILDQCDDARRYMLIACEVLYREVCFLTAKCRHTIDHRWMNQGLHDLGAEKMSAHIQQTIDDVPAEQYDAILLGFGLCNNGTLNLIARHVPLVIPRAHDCITLFLGSRKRYDAYFAANPGTYYLTTGWMERDQNVLEEESAESIPSQMGITMSKDEMIEKYGEENAAYLAETLGDLMKNYSRLTYIENDFDRELGFRQEASRRARERGWEFEVLESDISLLARLLDGEWDSDFLVIPPGESVAASYDKDIFKTTQD